MSSRNTWAASPRDIRAHLRGDLLVVRLHGVLTAAEQHPVTTLRAEKRRDLLKHVRSQLIEVGRPKFDAVVEDITGTKPLSLHDGIGTLTGEETVVVCAGRGALLSRNQEEVTRLFVGR